MVPAPPAVMVLVVAIGALLAPAMRKLPALTWVPAVMVPPTIPTSTSPAKVTVRMPALRSKVPAILDPEAMLKSPAGFCAVSATEPMPATTLVSTVKAPAVIAPPTTWLMPPVVVARLNALPALTGALSWSAPAVRLIAPFAVVVPPATVRLPVEVIVTARPPTALFAWTPALPVPL